MSVVLLRVDRCVHTELHQEFHPIPRQNRQNPKTPKVEQGIEPQVIRKQITFHKNSKMENYPITNVQSTMELTPYLDAKSLKALGIKNLMSNSETVRQIVST